MLDHLPANDVETSRSPGTAVCYPASASNTARNARIVTLKAASESATGWLENIAITTPDGTSIVTYWPCIPSAEYSGRDGSRTHHLFR